MDADRSLLRLSHALLASTYRHGRYRLMPIRDPKPRLIAVAPVRDRIVHTAVHRALAPHFDHSLIHDTYACLAGRGQHRALLRFLEFKRRFAFLMHVDIRGYYPSVDHDILRSLLLPRLRSPGVRRLLDHILASGWELYRRRRVREFFQMPGLEPGTRPHGLPIGNLTSQWWGNTYLDGLDQFVKRVLKVTGYLRYMDDMVLFADDRGQLKRWRTAMEAWLRQNRRLQLKEGKQEIKRCESGHEYLGYWVTRGGFEVGHKIRRRLRRRLPALALGSRDRLERFFIAWRGAVLL